MPTGGEVRDLAQRWLLLRGGGFAQGGEAFSETVTCSLNARCQSLKHRLVVGSARATDIHI